MGYYFRVHMLLFPYSAVSSSLLLESIFNPLTIGCRSRCRKYLFGSSQYRQSLNSQYWTRLFSRTEQCACVGDTEGYMERCLYCCLGRHLRTWGVIVVSTCLCIFRCFDCCLGRHLRICEVIVVSTCLWIVHGPELKKNFYIPKND